MPGQLLATASTRRAVPGSIQHRGLPRLPPHRCSRREVRPSGDREPSLPGGRQPHASRLPSAVVRLPNRGKGHHSAKDRRHPVDRARLAPHHRGLTWIVVSTTLADQKITVSDDASCLAGDEVDGPFSAYCEAMVIDKHALEATGGLRYAELDREDPKRRRPRPPRSCRPRCSPRWWPWGGGHGDCRRGAVHPDRSGDQGRGQDLIRTWPEAGGNPSDRLKAAGPSALVPGGRGRGAGSRA